METLITIAFGALFIYAIYIFVEKRKATVKKDTNYKDGATPRENKK